MEYEAIHVEKNDRVAVVRMNLPRQRNPLTRVLVTELQMALTEADGDPGIGAILLTGAGTAFSAGADLTELMSLPDKTAADLYYASRHAADLFLLGAQLRTPLIGAVNGPAFGGGMGLVAMCHLVVAAEGAQFGTTELRVGLIPFVILPLVRRAVGEKNALQLMLTAGPVGAEKALTMGLVQKVVPDDRLMEEAADLARHVASFSPLAVGLGLDAFFATADMNLHEAFDYLARLRLVSFLSDDLREGALSFLEKRSPQWKGR